jgi:chaperonin GroES
LSSAAEQPAQGEIIAVNGKITDNGVRALDVKVVTKYCFGTYAGTKVKVEGEELLVMKESDFSFLKVNSDHSLSEF